MNRLRNILTAVPAAILLLITLLLITVSARASYFLNFHDQQGAFTAGHTVYGATSGASATIVTIIDCGGSGTLSVDSVTGGPFVAGEVVYEEGYGEELLNNYDFSTGDFTGWDDATDPDTDEYVASYDGKSDLYHAIESTDTFKGRAASAIDLTRWAIYKREAHIYVVSASGSSDVRVISYYDIWEGEVYAAQYYGSGDVGQWTTAIIILQCKASGSKSGAVNLQVKNGAEAYFDYGSVKPVTNAATLDGNPYIATGKSITALWQYNEDGSISGFKFYRKTKGGAFDFDNYITHIHPGVHSVTFDSDAPYQFTVRAYADPVKCAEQNFSPCESTSSNEATNVRSFAVGGGM